MTSISNKSKIIVAATGFILVSALLFGYVFGLVDSHNANLADKVQSVRKDLAELEAEQHNFELGKKDIALLATKDIQPDSFFSADTKFVNEVQTLEKLSESLGVELTVQVTGTIANAPKAKTTTDIRMIPTTIQLVGSYTALVEFVQTLEHLQFVTNVKSISISPKEQGGEVALTLIGNFFLKK